MPRFGYLPKATNEQQKRSCLSMFLDLSGSLVVFHPGAGSPDSLSGTFCHAFCLSLALNKYGAKNYQTNKGFCVCLDLSPGLVLSHPGAGFPDALSKALYHILSWPFSISSNSY